MPRIDGGLLNCWRRAARKHGFIQERKKPCKNGMPGWKMKKEDEKRKMEEMHQQRVNQMIQSTEGGAGLLHRITRPTAWREGAQILKNEEEDARLLDR